MRYVIYGAGAVGGTIGARLHEHGREVVLIARGDHRRAIAERGLVLETPDATHRHEIPVVGGPDEIVWRADDVVLLAMKGNDTAAAVRSLAAVAPPSIAVVCAQNGVENERIALRAFADVYAARVSIVASHLVPGEIRLYCSPRSGIVDLGRYPEGTDEAARVVSADLEGAGFSSRTYPDVLRWKYRKLLTNLRNAAQALCAGSKFDRGGPLVAAAHDEAIACLEAAGIPVASHAEEEARRDGVFRILPVKGEAHRGSSSWQSLERRSGAIETEFLNGEIVLLGRLHGVPTPVNAALTEMATAWASERRGPGEFTEADILARAGARG